ncbi:hypothetical protein KR222_001326 [Zaprionus bogoriensis]|nr:hypothetical protein KR222_001326 [Zaprionus bogoriensis]
MLCSQIIGVWLRICIGFFTKDWGYGDYMLKENEVYSVFSMKEKPSQFLIVCKGVAVDRCQMLNIINSTFVECVEKTGPPRFITFPDMKVVCVKDTVNIKREMADKCAADYPVTEFSVLFLENAGSSELRSNDGTSIENAQNFKRSAIVICLILLVPFSYYSYWYYYHTINI